MNPYQSPAVIERKPVNWLMVFTRGYLAACALLMLGMTALLACGVAQVWSKGVRHPSDIVLLAIYSVVTVAGFYLAFGMKDYV